MIVHAVGLELSDLFADSGTTHYRPRRSRIPASDVLAGIDHEAHVVAVIAADVAANHDIDDDTWTRLALAVSRIGNARVGA